MATDNEIAALTAALEKVAAESPHLILTGNLLAAGMDKLRDEGAPAVRELAQSGVLLANAMHRLADSLDRGGAPGAAGAVASFLVDFAARRANARG